MGETESINALISLIKETNNLHKMLQDDGIIGNEYVPYVNDMNNNLHTFTTDEDFQKRRTALASAIKSGSLLLQKMQADKVFNRCQSHDDKYCIMGVLSKYDVDKITKAYLQCKTHDIDNKGKITVTEEGFSMHNQTAYITTALIVLILVALQQGLFNRLGNAVLGFKINPLYVTGLAAAAIFAVYGTSPLRAVTVLF